MTSGPEIDPRTRFVTLIDHLERRRAISDQAMWLAPVLVVAGQAFLLQVLSDGGLATAARATVLLAGVLASLAALLTLLRGRGREIQYSEAIAHESRRAGFPDVRSPALLGRKPLETPSPWNRLDRQVAISALSKPVPPAPLLWEVTLVGLIAADVAVYCTA